MIGGLDALASDGAQISAEQLEQRQPGTTAEDLATIVYTSGTTGRPKGCRLTHGNLLADVRNAVGALPEIFETPGCSTLLFLPLAHVFARIIQVGYLESGAVLGHWPDMNTLAEGLREFRPTFLLAPPRKRRSPGSRPVTARPPAVAPAWPCGCGTPCSTGSSMAGCGRRPAAGCG